MVGVRQCIPKHVIKGQVGVRQCIPKHVIRKQVLDSEYRDRSSRGR